MKVHCHNASGKEFVPDGSIEVWGQQSLRWNQPPVGYMTSHSSHLG